MSMRTSEPGVFAAGDSASIIFNVVTGKERTTFLWQPMLSARLHVGPNMLEPTAAYAGTQASSAVQLYNYSMAAAGLTVEGKGSSVATSTIPFPSPRTIT